MIRYLWKYDHGGNKMKKIVTVFVSVITMLSVTVSLNAASLSYVLSSSHHDYYSSYIRVTDYDKKWYVYVTEVSFSGMPSGTHPVNYEIYFRPYDGTTAASSSYLTFSYKSSGSANIGHTGASLGYKNGYGDHNDILRIKSNSSYYSKNQTVTANWTP